MSIERYRTGHAGRPVRAITMEDRARRYKAMKLIEPHIEELVAWHLAEFRNPENTKLERHKFGKFLWEACFANVKPHHLPQANGDGRNLPSVECAARGIKGVSPDFSLMTMKLPAFNAPNELAWPPHETPLAVQVAASMVPVATDPRQYTGDWWKVQQERARAMREQQLREQQQRQAEADANYHGPRWWERDAS
jgi:hypothetical protein